MWESILIVTALIGIAVLFYPQRGLYYAWRKHMRSAERVLLEDALKHLYNSEYSGTPSTLESLAGAIGIDRDRASQLVERLNARGLITLSGVSLNLTNEGRDYALKVIRIHRLWERYLADETMVRELEWHRQAEEVEHTLSPEDVQDLSKRLGHPVYDPHGDPIPTAAGELPEQKGGPLQSFADGEIVTIIHVEDEPAHVYEQIVSEGIYPGMTVRLLNRGTDSVLIEKEGKRVELPLIVAANVRGIRSKREQYTAEHKSLSDLRIGERGIVVGISPACRGMQRRRLMDLGIVPGTTIEAELTSTFGDPTAYRVRGSTIALRKEQAEMIYIKEGESR